jgi:hypothetical protein
MSLYRSSSTLCTSLTRSHRRTFFATVCGGATLSHLMTTGSHLRRRRSDLPEFIQTDLDIDSLADEIFSRYAGEQSIVIEGVTYATTFFEPGYCPDFRVMKLAGMLALRVNQHAIRERELVAPMRVTVPEIMLAALLHDLGKQHEDCAPFLQLLEQTDLRGSTTAEGAKRKQYLLGIVRDVHCRKGPCVIDRLADAGRRRLRAQSLHQAGLLVGAGDKRRHPGRRLRCAHIGRT